MAKASLLQVVLASCVLASIVAADAAAAVAGPMYPPPGGVTFSGSGSAGQTGGRTNNYSNLSPTDLSSGLYWGKDSSVAVQLSLDGGGYTGGETMTFAGIAGNKATWTGSTNLQINNGFGYTTTPVSTRFTLTATDAANAPLSFVTPASVDPAFPTAANAVVPVTGDFHINLLFEAFYGGNWQPAVTLFNSLSTNPATSSATSFGGAFYIVPEPTSLAFVAGAAVLLLGRRRRVA